MKNISCQRCAALLIVQDHSTRKWCDSCKNKVIGERRWGDNNPNWKGDQVAYNALHRSIERRIEKPLACSNCGAKSKLDLANISQKYLRDISDWEWLCRKCHMAKDGRVKRLVSMGSTPRPKICIICNKHFMGVRGKRLCSQECERVRQSQHNAKWRAANLDRVRIIQREAARRKRAKER